MIQEVPYGTYIEMQTYSNDLPVSIVIVPHETHKIIEKAIVHTRERVISCKCQLIICFIMSFPVIGLLLSIIIPNEIY